MIASEDGKGLIVFDLDGTLCDIEHRRSLVTKPRSDWLEFYRACVDDKPKKQVLRVMRALLRERNMIQIWSGRSEIVREATMDWFNRHAPWAMGIKLLMRPDKDYTPDNELKEGWLDSIHENTDLRVELVFDDRQKVVDMWRRRGITCMQVATGNF